MKTHNQRRMFVVELIGTFFLLTIVVGSGIMGDRLSNGSVSLALLANSIATGTGLVVLILMFGSVSGAHFNPLVSFAEYLHGRLSLGYLGTYLLAQALGAFAGVIAAHVMFGEPYLSFSNHDRSGTSSMFSEFIATFGLVAVIRGVGANRRSDLPIAIGLYIASAYWFTASTSFANPVATLARAFTSTFAGIRLADVPGFCLAQLAGATSAELVFKWLEGGAQDKSKEVKLQ